MPAMNYFDSNRTKTVRHLVAVPFTSFGNFELILNYLFKNEIFYNKDVDVNMKNIFFAYFPT